MKDEILSSILKKNMIKDKMVKKETVEKQVGKQANIL